MDFDKEKIEYFQNIVSGDRKASKKGAEVFEFLRQAVLQQKN